MLGNVINTSKRFYYTAAERTFHHKTGGSIHFLVNSNMQAQNNCDLLVPYLPKLRFICLITVNIPNRVI